MRLAASALLALSATLLVALDAVAQRPDAAERERRLRQELATPRPIAASSSVWIEELTWMEIRDRMAAGANTVIIPTGGIEQNGPYVALGKHNYVLETACDRIARALANALCAPIIKLVPEGNIDEPSGHMRYPGTISLREETFRAVLDDVGSSMHAHGFEHIVYIGDSGGNQRGMEAVAAALNERWGEDAAVYVPEFYDNAGLTAYMNEELGIVEPRNDGVHDFYWLTAMQMVTDPATVRYGERVAAGKAHINGVSIHPLDETLAVGEKLIAWRVERTVAAIRERIGPMTVR